MPGHLLYEIDLEHKTAFCTYCRDYVEIVIRETRTGKPKRPACINGANEKKRRYLEKKALDRQAKQRVRTRHTLTEVDLKARTAICVICGPIDIWIYQRPNQEKPYYACGAHSRELALRHSRPRNKNHRVNSHTLSEINEAAQTAICAVCGPVKIVVGRVNQKVTRRCANALPAGAEER